MDTDRPMIGSTNVRLEVENIIDLVEHEDSPVTLLHLHVKTVVSLHPSHREFSDHAAETWHSCSDIDKWMFSTWALVRNLKSLQCCKFSTSEATIEIRSRARSAELGLFVVRSVDATENSTSTLFLVHPHPSSQTLASVTACYTHDGGHYASEQEF